MIFYKHYIGDYQSATTHLTLIEHGVYRTLLDDYYSKERPLPLDHKLIAKICHASTRGERDAIETVLSQFFVRSASGYVHARVERELASAQARSERLRANAARGGRQSAERRLANQHAAAWQAAPGVAMHASTQTEAGSTTAMLVAREQAASRPRAAPASRHPATPEPADPEPVADFESNLASDLALDLAPNFKPNVASVIDRHDDNDSDDDNDNDNDDSVFNIDSDVDSEHDIDEDIDTDIEDLRYDINDIAHHHVHYDDGEFGCGHGRYDRLGFEPAHEGCTGLIHRGVQRLRTQTPMQAAAPANAIANAAAYASADGAASQSQSQSQSQIQNQNPAQCPPLGSSLQSDIGTTTALQYPHSRVRGLRTGTAASDASRDAFDHAFDHVFDDACHDPISKSAQRATAHTTASPAQIRQRSAVSACGRELPQEQVPEWWPGELWTQYRAHRRQRSAGRFSAGLEQRVRQDLIALHAQGHDPARVLQRSLQHGWLGLYPLPSARNDGPGAAWRATMRQSSAAAAGSYRAAIDQFGGLL